MTRYVEIAVNLPQVSGTFDYHLPPELEGRVQPGSLVVVPFGKQIVQGIVLRGIETPQVPQTRPISELVDPLPVLTSAQLALGQWIAEDTLSPLSACLDMMVPPGLSQHSEIIVQLAPGAAQAVPEGLPAAQQQVVSLLIQRGGLRGSQIAAALPHLDWEKTAAALKKRGLVTTSSMLNPVKVRPKTIRMVQLIITPEELAGIDARLGSRPEVTARRKAVLDFLARQRWPVGMPWLLVETKANAQDLQKLADLHLVAFSESEIWRDPLGKMPELDDTPHILTPAQQQAWQTLHAGLNHAAGGDPVQPYLLYGVTGSGKTEIYLHAVAETLRLGRQAVVLVPEISLTPQTLRRFLARFPGQVGVIHSRLSMGERYDTWRRVRAGLLPVVVGSRSALFAPLPNPGLIILDECHDDSYYQGDLQPNYDAVSAAVAYARLSRAVMVAGSATPDIEQMHRAGRGEWRLLSLPERLTTAQPGTPTSAGIIQELPSVEVVDMRAELKSGNRAIFSRALQAALKRVLAAGQQGILFLNRRGSATYVFCRACGAALHCPRCDRPLIFHSPTAALTCHTCGYQRKLPPKCPVCSSTQIRQLGTGTERVESELQALLPQARILRWDAETTRQKGAHEIILSHFIAHRADFLVGTQMLAKGLDLPLVTLVGVVLAEVGLNLPDYRAGERTFQVLTQVAGRAGRSALGGQVFFQTYQPEHYVIKAAAAQNYKSFYTAELAYRKQLGYPPFTRLVRLEYRHPRAEEAQKAAESLAQQLQSWLAAEGRSATSLIGPAPCFFSREAGEYRWHIILRGPDPVSLLRHHPLPDGWRSQVDPTSLL